MNITGIIPVRMASTRFPGKPLAEILGIPMVRHVYRRSEMSKMLNGVYVATCDKEIADYCSRNGMKAVMTKDTHERAIDRCAEAMLKIEKGSGRKTDIVVVIQGDEPMVLPEMIELAVGPLLKDGSVDVTNLLGEIKTDKEAGDRNAVKVVVDKNYNALYYSRAPIPSGVRTREGVARYKQVPIIPFRHDFLMTFCGLPQTPLEIAESVDMLRVLEHGYKARMVVSPFDNQSVDIPEDIALVERLMKDDPLISKYS